MDLYLKKCVFSGTKCGCRGGCGFDYRLEEMYYSHCLPVTKLSSALSSPTLHIVSQKLGAKLYVAYTMKQKKTCLLIY